MGFLCFQINFLTKFSDNINWLLAAESRLYSEANYMKNTYYLAISDTVYHIIGFHAYKMSSIAVVTVAKEGTRVS